MRKLRARTLERQQMRVQGIVHANRQEIWIITLDNIKILPPWLKDHRFFPSHPVANQFWLLPKIAAGLITWARTIHVGYQVTRTEFKRCYVCHRPTVGSQAARLRMQMESCPEGRTLPCGPNCARDAETGLWHKTTEVAA